MTETDTIERCLACGRTQDETVLIALTYRSEALWNCPQHMPVLIHDPQALVGKLAGASEMAPAEHND